MVFHAIRLVARSPSVSIAAQGFFLRLIPLVDSASLCSTWSIARVAERLNLSQSSVKRYRAELLAIGALEKRSGWYIIPEHNDRLKYDTSVSYLTPEQTDRLKSDTNTVSDLTLSNNYRSSLSSTFLAAAATRARERNSFSFPKRFLPSFGERKPTHHFEQSAWSTAWSTALGEAWSFAEWTSYVCPYLDTDEQSELFYVLVGKKTPSLAFATAVVNRIVSGRRTPANRGRVPVDVGEFSDCLE